jgi:hypothetical protein
MRENIFLEEIIQELGTIENENIGGRQVVEYAGITTTLSAVISSATTSDIQIQDISTLDINIGDYLLIDKENGNEIPIGSEPYFSNNKKYFACGLLNCYGGNSGEFQIFDVKENGKVKYGMIWLLLTHN